jgi:hypothetical protein
MSSNAWLIEPTMLIKTNMLEMSAKFLTPCLLKMAVLGKAGKDQLHSDFRLFLVFIDSRER